MAALCAVKLDLECSFDLLILLGGMVTVFWSLFFVIAVKFT